MRKHADPIEFGRQTLGRQAEDHSLRLTPVGSLSPLGLGGVAAPQMSGRRAQSTDLPEPQCAQHASASGRKWTSEVLAVRVRHEPESEDAGYSSGGSATSQDRKARPASEMGLEHDPARIQSKAP